MSLADALRQEPQKRNNCVVDKLRKELTGEDLIAFNEAINKIASVDPAIRSTGFAGYSAAWLSRVLRENGIRASREAIAKHAIAGCSCESV